MTHVRFSDKTTLIPTICNSITDLRLTYGPSGNATLFKRGLVPNISYVYTDFFPWQWMQSQTVAAVCGVPRQCPAQHDTIFWTYRKEDRSKRHPQQQYLSRQNKWQKTNFNANLFYEPISTTRFELEVATTDRRIEAGSRIKTCIACVRE